MNQVIIGTSALRAALLTLRTRAENAEDPAGYYEGGIDVLTALLPEADVAEARPAMPATSPPTDPRIEEAARFAEDHEACHWCGVLYDAKWIRDDEHGWPTCERCREPQTEARNAEFPWVTPEGGQAFATLDELLPEAVPATPYKVINLTEKRAVWAVMAMIDYADGQPARREWQTFADKASAAGYCLNFLSPTDTIAEPDASLGPASVEEAPPVGQPEAPPPPPFPAAEGEQIPEAERAPDDLTPAAPEPAATAAPPAATASHTAERLAMFRPAWVDGGLSVAEIFQRWNALPGPEMKNSTGLYSVAKKLGLPTQRPTVSASASTVPASAPTAKDEVFEAFDGGMTVRDASAEFGLPMSTLSNWHAEWKLKRRPVESKPPFASASPGEDTAA